MTTSHSRWDAQPTDFVGGPQLYPAPDWSENAVVARAWLASEGTIGWTIRQGEDRLAYLSAGKPGSLGETVADLVFEYLRTAPGQGVAVMDAWSTVLRMTFHDPPDTDYLPAVLAEYHRLTG